VNILAAVEKEQLNTLAAAIKAAGLTAPVEDAGTTWTLFAPTDAAFEKLLATLKVTQSVLFSDKALLTKVRLPTLAAVVTIMHWISKRFRP
jgi:uncharacterized surface protein with fasciclin (FAS1) repeats